MASSGFLRGVGFGALAAAPEHVDLRAELHAEVDAAHRLLQGVGADARVVGGERAVLEDRIAEQVGRRHRHGQARVGQRLLEFARRSGRARPASASIGTRSLSWRLTPIAPTSASRCTISTGVRSRPHRLAERVAAGVADRPEAEREPVRRGRIEAVRHGLHCSITPLAQPAGDAFDLTRATSTGSLICCESIRQVQDVRSHRPREDAPRRRSCRKRLSLRRRWPLLPAVRRQPVSGRGQPARDNASWPSTSARRRCSASPRPRPSAVTRPTTTSIRTSGAGWRSRSCARAGPTTSARAAPARRRHVLGAASARRVTLGGEPAVLTVFNDISEQVEAERALKASEERLAAQSRALTSLTAQPRRSATTASSERLRGILDAWPRRRWRWSASAVALAEGARASSASACIGAAPAFTNRGARAARARRRPPISTRSNASA